MSTMITFAANNELFRKRKRVHKACESCKKRRKRCSHTFDAEENDRTSPPDTVPERAAAQPRPLSFGSSRNIVQPSSFHELANGDRGDSGDDRSGEQSGMDKSASATPPRFVGYLSPEAVLRQGKGHKCGYWVREGEEERAAPAPSSLRHQYEPPAPGILAPPEKTAVEQALEAYLEAVGVSIVPPKPHRDALVDIYFTYVHPLLPILDQETFQKRYHEGTAPRMLVQAICIVASKHDRARPHLILSDDASSLYEPRNFGKKLYASINAAINAKVETDRIMLIQVLALLSLYREGSDGAEQSSMHIAQAIHHAHTFGLQFGGHTRHSNQEVYERLFWCLWSLDKLNACINGRPLIIHDRDCNIRSMHNDPEKRRTPFAIWLQLAEALDKVINLYRPGTEHENTGWEVDFPSFEDIVGDGDEQLDGPAIAALELFYHAVAMASHKSGSVHDPVRSTASYVRQSLSAVRVISILSTDSPDDLPPVPIVPYALSLAMSVAYRRFRQSKLQMHKNRAKEDLKICCTLLSRLRTAWWAAGAMEDLGRAALSKADRSNNERQSISESSTSAVNDSLPLASSSGFHHSIATPTSVRPANPQTFPAVNSSPVANILNVDNSSVLPGQHPISSERAAAGSSALNDFDFGESLDWLNFDNAFENIDTLLGSSGAEISNQLLRPFNYEGFDFTGL